MTALYEASNTTFCFMKSYMHFTARFTSILLYARTRFYTRINKQRLYVNKRNSIIEYQQTFKFAIYARKHIVREEETTPCCIVEGGKEENDDESRGDTHLVRSLVLRSNESAKIVSFPYRKILYTLKNLSTKKTRKQMGKNL